MGYTLNMKQNMKHQVVVIHGGNSFKTRKAYFGFLKALRIDFKRYLSAKISWKKRLGKALGRNYEVILPDMPNKMNAKYAEWKIWFKKFIPHLRPGVILIGHSMGGVFLAKYLSETRFPKRIRAVFIIAAPTGAGDFAPPKNLKKVGAQAEKIFLYYSKDDPVVPFADLKKYQQSLQSATIRIFRNRGHFNQEKLPELVNDIRNLD